MKNENVDSHDCRDEDFLARAPRGPMRTRQRTIPVFGIAFALAAVLLLSLTSFAPAVQALSEEYLDDYSFTPSGTSESEPLVGDGSVTLDESAIPEEPRTIDSLPDLGHGSETRSFYTQVDPLLMDVLFRPSPDTTVTDGTGSIPLNDTYALSSSADSGKDYWNVNTYGRYRFGSEDFSRMTLLEDDTSILTSSYFDVRSENGTSLGPAAVQERSASIFVTSQQLSVDGTSVGSFFVKSEFLTNDRPKISAWISTGSEYEFEIVWNIRLDEGYVRTSEGVFPISNLTDSGYLPAESMSFEYGSLTPENRWRGTFLVDWSDAGCGNLSLVEDTDGCAARIVFPSGMHSVDPTLVATSECSYATSGSPFRNTVYYSGTYWLFYGSWDGLFYVRSADNGATWSQSTQLPIGSYVERPGMFDVAIHGSHIAVASLWKDYSADAYNIGFIDGYISGSSIQWNSWSPVRSMPDSMFGWFGGVSLGADGAAYICYAEVIESLMEDIRLVTLQKLPYSPSFVELDNHFPEYNLPTLPSQDRPFLRPRVVTTSDDSVVFMELVGFDDPLVPAELTVTSPNGGEAWTAGTQHTITWTSSGAGANVKIELVRPWVTLTIDESDPNDGSYAWSIAPDQAASSEYTIRITDTSDSSIVDQSDSTFTIVPRVPIQVVSPNGGESWQRGKQYPITWGGTAGSVKIDLLDVGSGLLTTLANNYPNTGVYPWSISPTQAIDVDYKMKITDLQSMSIDYSNSVFSIIPLASNSITVISPNGGESWLRGSTQQIKWTSTGPIDVSSSLVKIELLSSGMFAATIDSSEPNDGAYEWTIPSDTELRGDYSVRLTSISYPTVYDTSNAPFAITYDIPSDWLDYCSIIWNVYRPESGTWQSLVPWTHPMTLDSVDQFSVCPGGKDEIHLACLSSSGSLGYDNIWLDEDGLPAHSYTDLGVTALKWPSISIDPNEDVHIQYSMSGRVYELHAYPSEDTWAPSVEMGTGQTYTVSCLSSGEKLESRNHVSFVNALSATSSQIMFGALPLPADIIGPYGDPWSGGGINQDQPFNMGVSDVVSPGNGLLYLFQNDFVVPGRGTDIVVSHFYSTPQYFAPNSAGTLVPYLYDTFQYSSLGEGWQLNFPWVDDDYVHLWSGTKIKMEWKGDYFNNTKGQQFTMVKLTDGFRLDLQDGMRIEFNSDGSPARIFANRAIDSSNADIIFSYTTTAAGKRIYYVRDHLSRYVYFNHLTDGKLNTITRDGCSVTFLYTGSQLTSVRDPLNRVTGFDYGILGYPSILLSRITYPSSSSQSSTFIEYGYDQIDVGSDASAYVVSCRSMGYEGWKSYAYTAVDGIIRSAYVSDYSTTPFDRWIGDAVYDFDSESKATTVTYFGLDSYEYPYGDTTVPLKRTVSWYSPDGRVSRSETYDDFRSTPDTSTAYTDSKGNTIYTRDPIGHEAFSSFADTTTGNAFYRPGSLEVSSPGKVFFDNFGDWNPDGWSESSGGYLNIGDYLSDEGYMPSCKVAATSGVYYISVDLDSDGAGTAAVILDTLLQISSTDSDMRLVFTDDAGVTLTGIRFTYSSNWGTNRIAYLRSDGIWDNTGLPYSANVLYRVTLESEISSGAATTKLSLDGVLKYTYTRTVSAGLLANFRTEQVYTGTAPRCYIDNVKLMTDWDVTVDGLQTGKFVELYDSSGDLVDRIKATASSVTMSLDATDSFIPYANFVIRNDTGVAELVDTYREVWGGDRFTYTAPEYLRCAISKTTSGIDTATTQVLGDSIALSSYTTMGSTFSFIDDPDLVLSESKYHHDINSAGVGWHGYRAPDGVSPTAPSMPSSGFFIQAVYLPLDGIPVEIGLRYYSGLREWSDMAFWGTDAMILDDGGTEVKMGDLPAPGQWTFFLVKASDVGWTTTASVYGLNFTHLGGDPYFDRTSLTTDMNYGKISVTNLAVGQKVELRRPNGTLITSVTATSTTVALDLYSAGVRAFPLCGSFAVYDSSGQVLCESPVFRDIYPKDVFTFSTANSPFYANANTPDGFGGMAAGTMQFTDAAHTVSMESYYRYGRLSGTSWVDTSLVTESKTKDGTIWRTTSYSYDQYGNVLKVTDPSGAMLNYTYEQSGTYLDSSWIIVRSETGLQNLSAKFDYYSNGLLYTETDAKGYVTKYTYDSMDRPTMITYPSLSGTTVSVDYLYDNVNQVVTFQDEINTKTKTYYDGYGRIWKEERLAATGTSYSFREYTYCWNGRVDSIEDSSGRVTSVDYDYFGRVVKAYNSDDTARRTVYDDRNRTVSQYDELGNRKDSIYDANGRLVSAVQYFGPTKLYTYTTYDDIGNILSVTDCAGLMTSYQYDNMGRLKRTAYPYSVSEEYYYDSASRIQRIDRSGTYTDWVYSYDVAGRLTKRYFASNDYMNFTYDANGNVIYSVRSNYAGAISTSRTYDEWDRTKDEITIVDGTSYKVTYSYDTRSNINSIDALSGTYLLSFTYDEFNRVKTTTLKSGRSTIPLASLAYNNRDQMTSISYGNGVSTTYDVDPARGWIDRIYTEKSGTTLLDLNYYERDSTGRIKRINTDRTYVYDSLGRLTYANDTSAYGRFAFTYDTYGNRQTMTLGSTVTSYYYDDPYKRLTSSVTGSSTTSFDYSSLRGNLWHRTDSVSTIEFAYNMDDQMNVVKVDGTSVGFYSYDASGRRVKSVEDEASDVTIYAGSLPLVTISVAGKKTVQTLHAYVNGIHIAKYVSKVPYYYHLDHLGSVRLVTDQYGAVVFDTDYLPFGEPYMPDGTEAFLFADARTSKYAGLIGFGARDYNPETGRFTTPDPVLGALSTPTSLNRWVYCLNDPINRMDKYGTWSWGISLDSLIDVGGALFDSAVNLVGDAVEFVVDTVVEVVETAIEVVDAAIDVAEQFVTNAIRAADAVCSAVVAGCTAIKLAWDNLDPGLKQWIVMGLSIAAAVALPGIGGVLVSCLIDGSFVDIYNAVRSGDWGMLALSLTAFIPGGKALKGLKLLGHGDDIGKITKRLNKHLDKAMKNVEFTPAQKAAIAKNPGLTKAFRGERIDTAFKNRVGNDKWLMNRVDVTGRFQRGPDITLKEGGVWWDVTTSSQWTSHVSRYSGDFGVGIPLLY